MTGRTEPAGSVTPVPAAGVATWGRHLAAGVVLAAVVGFAYQDVASFEFVFDDLVLIGLGDPDWRVRKESVALVELLTERPALGLRAGSTTAHSGSGRTWSTMVSPEASTRASFT